MDILTIILIVLSSVLGLLALVLLVRYLGLRAELRAFREQINEIRTTDREQPIKVASFGAPSVELAREINLLVEELRTVANRSAEEERRVRTIMAGVSHDFRTPLTAADGYLQMSEDLLQGLLQGSGSGTAVKSAADAREAADSQGITELQYAVDTEGNDVVDPRRLQELSELRDYLKIVTERVRYLKALSDEFFEVTYLDAKKELPLEPVRFDTVLSEVILGQYDWMQERRIDMRMDIPEEQMTVRGDRHYLERILENLFSNARKYTKSFLEVRVERKDSDILLRMRNDVDSAMQIDPAHIFEPFYRAKDRSGSGTGLGLYVVKELSKAMHFRIEGKADGENFEISLCMQPYSDRKDSLS